MYKRETRKKELFYKKRGVPARQDKWPEAI